MADEICKVDRFSIDVPDKPGEGARILGALAAGKANLLAVWGYPLGRSGASRIEVVPKDTAALRAAAKAAKIKVKRESAALYAVGRDKLGVISGVVAKLSEKGVNIHAVQAVSVGTKYGCLIEVDSKAMRKAAKALGV
ncbi:MAG: hypothetical protein GY953_28445 [bacterium]|nr:hypothetical protein [bacterium]